MARRDVRAGALLALALAAAPGASIAQTADVSGLLRRGVDARRGRRDLEALALFQTAWEQCRCGEARVQIALAEEALGRWPEAEAHLREGLAMRDPWIERHRRALEAELAAVAGHLATVEVRGNVAGAEVWSEERLVGPLPAGEALRWRVAPGPLRVSVRAAGYEPQTRVARATAGETTALDVTLTPVPPPAPAGATTAAPAPRVSLRIVRAAPRRTVRARSLAWWMTGAAAVALVAGGVAQGLREYHVANWNDPARCLIGMRTRQENCERDSDAADTAQAWAIAGFVTAGALAATAVVLWVVSRESPAARRASPGWSCGGPVGDLGIACGARF